MNRQLMAGDVNLGAIPDRVASLAGVQLWLRVAMLTSSVDTASRVDEAVVAHTSIVVGTDEEWLFDLKYFGAGR